MTFQGRFLVLVLIVLGATRLLIHADAQFVEQPDPRTVFVPVQDRVSFTCAVEEGYIVDWCLAFPNGDKAVASSNIAISFLTQRNFSLEGVGTSRSTLSLWETETQTNNGTNITCLAREEINSDTGEIFGNTAIVLFYDALPSLTNLNVSENELGSLNISWSLGFIEGVPVNYTLTVLNLNTTSAQPIIIAGLLDQHYMFETSRPCDVYSFTVTAVTAAGNSTPSQEIIFTRNSSSEVCAATTREQSMSPKITVTNLLSTTPSLPTQNDSTQLTTTSCSYSTIIVSVVFAVLLSVSVLGNVIMCARYNKKKTKTVITSDLPDPVYETFKDVISARDAETPFAMTTSSAYGVSTNAHLQVNSIPTTLSSAYNSS